jgi:hypothetical protein
VGGGGVGGTGGGGGRGEKWPKPCMHIWIIKEKWKKKETIIYLGLPVWFLRSIALIGRVITLDAV